MVDSGAGGQGVIHNNAIPEDGPSIKDSMDQVDTTREAAWEFLRIMEIEPTSDAVGQLTEVFIPCLRIMCGRPWNPDGKTWRRSGRLGVLTDAHKKWDRFWERLWIHGKLHDDSGLDLINFIGFTLRSEDNRWGEWGEPGETGGR